MSKSTKGKRGKGKKSALSESQSESVHHCGLCKGECSGDLIECCACRLWFHRICANLDEEEYRVFTRGNHGIQWSCVNCLKAKGDEVKKLIQLENKIEELTKIIFKMEDNFIKKVDEQIEKKITDRLTEIESKLTNKMEGKIEEKTEHEKRKANMVIWNIPESKKTDPKEEKEDDEKNVLDILNKTSIISTENISKIERLGRKSDRPRLVKVIVKTTDMKDKIMKNQRKINEGESDKKNFIYINHDLTPAEREQGKKLREELKRRIGEGETNIGIRNSEIVSLKPRQGNNTDGVN